MTGLYHRRYFISIQHYSLPDKEYYGVGLQGHSNEGIRSSVEYRYNDDVKFYIYYKQIYIV